MTLSPVAMQLGEWINNAPASTVRSIGVLLAYGIVFPRLAFAMALFIYCISAWFV